MNEGARYANEKMDRDTMISHLASIATLLRQIRAELVEMREAIVPVCEDCGERHG